MLIYDLEIVKAIPVKKEPVVDGIEYCKGWGDHAGMGVSVLCAYDLDAGRPRIFCQDNLVEFASLCDDHDFLIGFNSIRFDNAVLAAAGIDLPEDRCYDLLREIWAGVGLGPKFNSRTHGGYTLDACCKANGIATKTGNGALAPIDWQQGRIGKVIDYCMNDVTITLALLDLIMMEGAINNPKLADNVIRVRRPEIAS